MEDQFDLRMRQLDRQNGELLLDLLFRLEHLEQRSGVASGADTFTRLMPVGTSIANDAVSEGIKRRLDLLEERVED